MSTPRKPQRPQKPIDPLLLQRLEELGGRRRGTPLPPPQPGAKPQQQQQRSSANATSGQSKRTSKDANARIAALAAARGPGKPSSNAPVGRRAKPARNAKLAALALSAVTSVGLAGVFANQDGGTDSIQLTNGTSADPLITVAPATVPASTVAPAADPAATVAPAADPATTVVAAPATVAAAPAGIIDGTYVGQSSSNRFGNVQVQVVYSGGQLSDVQILQYPNGDGRSLRISQIALPTLINESISSQSGSVNTVSGATYTSKSYKKSLQSAIDAAKAASGISG